MSLTIVSFSQQPVHRQPGFIQLRNGSIRAFRNIADGSFRKDSLRTDHFSQHYYALAQFDLLPDSVHKLEMANVGVRLFDYVADRTYLVELADNFTADLLKRYAISGVFRLPAASKLSTRLQQHAYEDLHDQGRLIAVGYFGNIPANVVRQGIIAAGASIETIKIQPPRVFFVRASDTAVLRRLSALPYVSYLSSQPFRPKALNYNNRAAQGADALGASSGRGLYGDGVVVGVGDNADPSTHVDFTGRLIMRTSAPVDYHGTHTTGSVAGGGILNPIYQGMAPHATVVSQFYSDILANAEIYRSDFDMLLTSNSYTDYNQGCSNDGEYDALAYYTDAQTYQDGYLLHMFAAGNDGTYTCSPYPSMYATVKSGFQVAKNALTVGALDNTNSTGTNTYISNYTSSAGPAADGRIKPEICAGGFNVTSTYPYNNYGTESGTSMATPDVTGTLALMVQRFRQLNGGGDPPAILLKALACNTATDLGNPGPDYIFGYGALNGLAATQAMEAGQYGFSQVSNGGAVNFNLTVPTGIAQARIMIYWNDYPATPYSATTLVNNLDLTVQDPSAVTHHPLILNPAAAHVADNAVEGVDNLNNIEQVVLNNPSGGTYHCSVAGTNVPYGPQSFVVVWQFIQPSIVVQYPYGNETWVPGQPEVIRWNATDGGTNPFTLDYSTDNGSTWTTISSSVAGNSQMYSWITPSTVTNQALVRVTRNSTAYSGQSTYPFTILGQPTLTGTSPCQGYAQLSWNTVTSATGYDIMQLIGDTMVKIASTTSTSYLVGHLNKDSSYWFGVRAVNGSTPGRRSISVNIQPSGSGSCTLSALDNDYTVDSAIGLSSGRLYTSSQLTASTPIQVEIKNLGTVPTGSSYAMNYSINGGTTVSETTSAAVAANGGAYNYTFATPADFSAQGTYTLQIWVSYPGDPQTGNDTLTTTIKQLSNDPITLTPSYTEGLESAASASYGPGTMGFTGLDRCDFHSSTNSSIARGRVRTFVNTGMCHSGNRCAILDQSPIDATFTTSDSLIMTFNLSNYTASDQLWLDFYYRNQGIDSTFGANQVWIRGNDQAAWLPVYTLDINAANVGVYQPSSHIDITGTLKNASPAQTISSSFQIKFGEQGHTTVNDVYTDGTIDNGYLYDDITLSRSINDLGLLSLVAPTAGNHCSFSSATSISVLLKNYTSTAVTNIPVTYVVNGDTVTENVPSLNGNDSLVYTFTTTVDMSAYQSYSISAWVNYPGDTYTANDTLATVTLHTSPLISTFPYLEGFETSNGDWFTGGVNSSWQWGAPQKTTINKAANGTNCWVTSLTGDYNNNELSYLYSPCFDLSSLTSPVLSFSHIFQTEDDCDCDYHWVEYSTNDSTWIKLGTVGNGTNWYDNSTRQSWQLSYPKWHVSSYDIPVTASKVRFRIVMSSDPATTFEGVAIDDVHVFDKATIYTGANDSLAQTVSGNNWINFDIGGNRIAAINPNGQNLGVTNVKVFFNQTGAIRYDNTPQYYLDRNIVIQPANAPSSPVSVRFYFTDAEATALMNATGCSTCTTIADAYEAGVTQFSSANAAEEDGTLANDTSGTFLFHQPRSAVSIVPNANGYYAEYQVNGFSEFWIDNGGLNNATPLPLNLLSFTAVRSGNNGLLQWSANDALNVSRFVIEKSSDNLHFTALDSLPAASNGSDINNYQYIDTHLDQGPNYYRLRIVDQDGRYSWSPIRTIDGRAAGGITIYPNPVQNGNLYISTTVNTQLIRLMDVSGKTILQLETQGYLNTLPVGAICHGIYFVEVVTDTGSSIQKILIN